MRYFRSASFVLIALYVLSVSLAHAQVIIIDDGGGTGSPNTVDIGWTPSSADGDWHYRGETGTSNKLGSYNDTGSRFAFYTAGATATYTPTIPTDGFYQVDMYWPTFGWANNVPVTINHAEGTTGLTVNQSINSDQWNTQGVYKFDAGTAGSLMISSIGTSAGTSNVGPVADAVRFSYLTDDPTAFPVFMTATASSTHPINSFRPVANLVNNSGMTDVSGDGVPETHGASNYGDDLSWMTNGLNIDDTTGVLNESAWVMLDMGSAMDLGSMKIWNFNTTNGADDRGVKDVDVYAALVASPGTDFSNTSQWTLLSTELLDIAPGASGYDTPNEIDLGGINT